MTLAVSAVYRGRGIGSKMLQSILEFCEQNRQQSQKTSSADDEDDDATISAGSISEIALHVQISNQDAIRFYTERFNFVQGERVDNYYRRIDPPHCYVLYKRLDDQELGKNEDTNTEIAPCDATSSGPDETKRNCQLIGNKAIERKII
jgi:ribosomal protein S18 acetylase RimI-like enzyme